MASTSSTYLLPGPPQSLINSKSILMKQSPPTILHQQYHRPMMKSIPTSNTFHSLTVPNMNNNNSSLILTTNNHDDSSGGSNGHSLSQSMESINNIGLPDDEVRSRHPTRSKRFFHSGK